MSTKYHISKETGRPNICYAKEGNCPLKTDEGKTAPHFDSKEEARAHFEKGMEKEILNKVSKKDTSPKKSNKNSTIKEFDPSQQSVFSNKMARSNAHMAEKAIKKELDNISWLQELKTKDTAELNSVHNNPEEKEWYSKTIEEGEVKILQGKARLQAQLKECEWLLENNEGFKKTAAAGLKAQVKLYKNSADANSLATFKTYPIK